MNRKLLIAALLILLPALAFGQAGKVRGLITDEATGEPLIGANVSIEGTTLGASTDMNGVYVVLAIPPGLYTIRTSYIGYQTEAISNVRVSSNQTTTQDFDLATEAIRGEALVVIAERPLIQRNTTNTVRMTTEEDIQSLPVRGVNAILALNAGTVMQDGNLHIRGGREREIAFFVDGATTTSVMDQEGSINVIQEAIEEIQMQAGGFTAEYGGANSGVVNTTMRTGGSQTRISMDYRTDDFATGGDEFLGTTSRGYHNAVATIGGPLLGTKLRYFVAGQYNYLRNRQSQFIEPFSFDPMGDAPWWVEDGGQGRSDFVGMPMTSGAGDTIPLTFERNFLPNNSRKDINVQGTLVYNLSKSFKFRLTGVYSWRQWPNGWGNFTSALNNYYSTTEDESQRQNTLVNLRGTHILNPTTFYDIAVSYSQEKYHNIDPRFGHDWQSYADSVAWGAAGYDASNWDAMFDGPIRYSGLYDFDMAAPNSPNNNYTNNVHRNLGISFDFTTQLNRNLEIKFGGRADMWNIRQKNVGNIAQYMETLYGADGSLRSTDNPGVDGDHSLRDFTSADGAFSHDYMKMLELMKRGGVNNYGWDYSGTTKIEEGPYGPKKPFYGSAYVQTKFEYRDLILNLGLRVERYNYNDYRPKDLEFALPESGEPDYDKTNEWIDVDKLVKIEPYDYILPRLNFAFPVTETTVFYAQYGKYVQNVAYESVFRSVNQLRNLLPETRTPLYSANRSLIKPERTNQYELGIRQTLSPEFAFTITAFYKDLMDQVRYGRIYADGMGELPRGTQIVGSWLNNDIGTSKGLELTLELRRTKRLAAKVNYTISDTRGTGSAMGSNSVVQTDETRARFPTFIYPLDYNQTHRGSIVLDYRFARGDGGKILEGLGLYTLFTFNSGHPYTSIVEPSSLGQASVWEIGVESMNDHRSRIPNAPVNSSVTPWNFNIDLTLEKMVYLGRVNLKFYTNVLNLLNTKNIINVYDQTGVANDDGWLKTPEASSYRAIPGYETYYTTINLLNEWGYQRANGGSLWGIPRQIRLGVSIEFQ